MVTLENDYLRIGINYKGAELNSLYHKITGVEHLWQADPTVWAWHAPNLFPVVGGCIKNEIWVDGKVYPMERHGFARHSVFSLIEASDTKAKFSLSHSEKTLAVYPFRFSFQVIYELLGPELKITYKVINYDDKPVWFSVGAHPAFNIPFSNSKEDVLEDYYLEFDSQEPLEKHLLSDNGFFTGETESVLSNSNILPLRKELFAQDALVFKNINSREVSIKSRKHPNSVSVQFQQFNYLGIWAKKKVTFLCIEPWLGCADSENKPVDLKDKEAIQKVEPGHVFEADYRILIS
ncbi:MAG TPA: aldose 1-epimerase family protein [Daejeonella sp.]|nr:aldose 1-epimerase family protein [Daejeonella sp.]